MISSKRSSPFPAAVITNGLLRVKIYLPDTLRGYYRSTRFDWSGVMPEISYRGHTFSGQWFDHYNPTTNDAIMGPVESFAPLGYSDPQADGAFTQIGVGVLEKPAEKPYNYFHYYRILDPGVWRIKKARHQIDFIQELSGGPYPYTYEKEIRLVPGEPRMELIHHLKNTGKRSIETEVYDHNLFLIDSGATAPGMEIAFPFELSSETAGRRGIGDIATIGDHQISFLKAPGSKQAYAVLGGYGPSAKDYDIRMENHISGAGIRITCDQPLSKLVFWASGRIFCPEPYIHIHVAPGETFNWTMTYQFYATSDKTSHEN